MAQAGEDDGRHDEAEGVDGEGGAGVDDAQQQAAQGVAEEQRRLHRDVREREGQRVVRPLGTRSGMAAERAASNAGVAKPGEEGEEEQGADRQVEQHGAEAGGAGDVGDDHHRHPAVAVGEGGQDLTDPDEPDQRDGGDARGPGRRAGALEHQDGQGEAAGPVAQEGDDISGPDTSEGAGSGRGESSAPPRRRSAPFLAASATAAPYGQATRCTSMPHGACGRARSARLDAVRSAGSVIRRRGRSGQAGSSPASSSLAPSVAGSSPETPCRRRGRSGAAGAPGARPTRRSPAWRCTRYWAPVRPAIRSSLTRGASR